LGAGQCPEGPHRFAALEPGPETFGSAPRERVLDPNGAAQADHVARVVIALDAGPAPKCRPTAFQLRDLERGVRPGRRRLPVAPTALALFARQPAARPGSRRLLRIVCLHSSLRGLGKDPVCGNGEEADELVRED